MQVQEELIRRSTGHVGTSGKKRNFSCSHPFSQIVFYGECREIYRRVHWNNRGKKPIVWRCVSRLENTGLSCNSRTVFEDLLKYAVVKAINDLLRQKNDFLEVLSNNIETVINEQDTSAIAEIEKKLEDLRKQLLIWANSKEDYNDNADEVYRLREEKHYALAEDAEKKAAGQRLMDMTAFLKEQPTLIDEFYEQLIRRLIGKIMVNEDRFTVDFKFGVEVEVEM